MCGGWEVHVYTLGTARDVTISTSRSTHAPQHTSESEKPFFSSTPFCSLDSLVLRTQLALLSLSLSLFLLPRAPNASHLKNRNKRSFYKSQVCELRSFTTSAAELVTVTVGGRLQEARRILCSRCDGVAAGHGRRFSARWATSHLPSCLCLIWRVLQLHLAQHSFHLAIPATAPHLPPVLPMQPRCM